MTYELGLAFWAGEDPLCKSIGKVCIPWKTSKAWAFPESRNGLFLDAFCDYENRSVSDITNHAKTCAFHQNS